MPTPKKEAEVQEITVLLKESSLAILTDYRGLSVTDLQRLRSQLRPHQASIRVVKNTLTAIAAEQAGMASIQPWLEGPTALVTTSQDVVAPSKVINDFVRTSRILQIKGALLEGQLIPAAEIENLATLPPREVLLARVVGGLQAPMYGLVGVLAGTIRQLGYVLNARAEQLGGSESQAA